jgi:predicted transposase YbfD/YdcC
MLQKLVLYSALNPNSRCILFRRFALSVLSAFSCLTDPRVARTRRYPLGDLLLLILCGLLCGADNYVAICRWATARKDWLAQSLGIVAIPSHDTLGRLLAKLDGRELASFLTRWNSELWEKEKQEGDVVAFDGKRVKGAANNLNLLTAWASRAQMTLGLTDAGEGGEEQAALRQLLKIVNVSDCVVTADAMHTQTETAQAILDHGADYVLALKANQQATHDSAIFCFEQMRQGEIRPNSRCSHRMKDRGVREERECLTLTDVSLVDPSEKWAGLKTVVCVTRRVYKEQALLSEQTRYFLSSATGKACHFLGMIRHHWGIENSQHWRLDVYFREDDSRVRKGQAATNLATLRRLALSLVKRETTQKVGVQTKRQMAGWDNDYLEKLLAI